MNQRIPTHTSPDSSCKSYMYINCLTLKKMYLNTGRIYNNCKHIILQNITLKLESLVAPISKVYRHFQLNDVVFMHKNNICVVLIRIDGCAGLLSIKPTWGYDRSVMTGLHQNSLTLRHMTVCDTCPLCAGGQL